MVLLCAAVIISVAVIHVSRASAPASASRPPVCRLGTCEGRDPKSTACEDPETLATYTAADGTRLEIRHSPSCRAAWVRTWPRHSGFRIRLTGPAGHPQTAVVPRSRRAGTVRHHAYDRCTSARPPASVLPEPFLAPAALTRAD
ncbi:DUF2690 domain-containing protein [Streptomyces sp. NPDC005202]|uniref:DUF2690 domain-containing protein n=1 Tax=Streptomyces sp. NPDC005202 TaxID=3157021 RepID=UPI0033B9CE80